MNLHTNKELAELENWTEKVKPVEQFRKNLKMLIWVIIVLLFIAVTAKMATANHNDNFQLLAEQTTQQTSTTNSKLEITTSRVKMYLDNQLIFDIDKNQNTTQEHVHSKNVSLTYNPITVEIDNNTKTTQMVEAINKTLSQECSQLNATLTGYILGSRDQVREDLIAYISNTLLPKTSELDKLKADNDACNLQLSTCTINGTAVSTQIETRKTALDDCVEEKRQLGMITFVAGIGGVGLMGVIIFLALRQRKLGSL